jgi:hypothetical protein
MSREELLRLDLSGSDFVATSPEADSLSFFSKTATYDLLSYIIDAKGVRLIRVADAGIFPDSGYVRISRGGQIQKLANTGIIADTANQYHLIEKAEVSIYSRKSFEAKGKYQYTDINGVLQEFPLNLISVDTTERTFAEGTISEKAKFHHESLTLILRGMSDLSLTGKNFILKEASVPMRIAFGNKLKNWVAFSSWVDPANVRIPDTASAGGYRRQPDRSGYPDFRLPGRDLWQLV